jgi:hypothetical protein
MQKKFCTVQYILAFTGFLNKIGLLESVFRAIVNKSRVYPPLAGLSAIFLVRRLSGGVADWRTGGLAHRFCGGLDCWPSHGQIIHGTENTRFKT